MLSEIPFFVEGVCCCRKGCVPAAVGPSAASGLLGKHVLLSVCLPVALRPLHLTFHPSLSHTISERKGNFKSVEDYFYTIKLYM